MRAAAFLFLAIAAACRAPVRGPYSPTPEDRPRDTVRAERLSKEAADPRGGGRWNGTPPGGLLRHPECNEQRLWACNATPAGGRGPRSSGGRGERHVAGPLDELAQSVIVGVLDTAHPCIIHDARPSGPQSRLLSPRCRELVVQSPECRR